MPDMSMQVRRSAWVAVGHLVVLDIQAAGSFLNTSQNRTALPAFVRTTAGSIWGVHVGAGYAESDDPAGCYRCQRGHLGGQSVDSGFMPAHAGWPGIPASQRVAYEVNPRAYGEADRWPARNQRLVGLSQRMRDFPTNPLTIIVSLGQEVLRRRESLGTVLLEADGEDEGEEQFVVEMFLPGNYWAPDPRATMTIIDGD